MEKSETFASRALKNLAVIESKYPSTIKHVSNIYSTYSNMKVITKTHITVNQTWDRDHIHSSVAFTQYGKHHAESHTSNQNACQKIVNDKVTSGNVFISLPFICGNVFISLPLAKKFALKRSVVQTILKCLLKVSHIRMQQECFVLIAVGSTATKKQYFVEHQPNKNKTLCPIASIVYLFDAGKLVRASIYTDIVSIQVHAIYTH